MQIPLTKRVPPRRPWLPILGLALIIVLVTGLFTACGGGGQPATTEQPAPAAQPEEKPAVEEAPAEEATEDMGGASIHEAPMLRELVKAGQLPPLKERLPEEPLVVQPVERIGVYGGTWNTALMGGQDNAWLIRTISYEHLVRWDPNFTKVIPNIAKAYDISEDASELPSISARE